MATYNLNVTASVDLLGSDISGSQSTDFAIANPLSGSSYFTFETVRNSDGFYDSSSPKNMAGTYTLGAGLAGLIKSDYIASVVVEPGGGTLTFVPTNYISGSSLNLRGTTSPPPAVAGAFSGLLDTYSGAAAAYSLRLLSTSYTGSAIRVRRASDNTEQDIGFVNNVLDTTTLASFCSGTNGFVTTWYDQSGNGNNATQTTAANQPKVYDSSTGVITENGKPSIYFGWAGNTASVRLATGSLTTISQPYSVFNAFSTNTDNAQNIFDGTTSNSQIGFFNAKWFMVNDTTTYGTSTTLMQLHSNFFNSSVNFNASYNGGTLSNLDYYASSLNGITLGHLRNAFATNYQFNGNLSETIVYPSNQSTNRTGIETNINNFYSIY